MEIHRNIYNLIGVHELYDGQRCTQERGRGGGSVSGGWGRMGEVFLKNFSLHHWRGIHVKRRSRFLVQLVKTRAFTCTFPYGQAGLSFTAWSNSCEQDTHCYIYLKACQVFALILAYLQEGMWMGSQDKRFRGVWKLGEKIHIGYKELKKWKDSGK